MQGLNNSIALVDRQNRLGKSFNYAYVYVVWAGERYILRPSAT
jgi:hypothetical protein